MKIYAPVKDANGVYASVRFVNGVGETDNPRLIKWFKEHGYKVPLEDTENSQETCDKVIEEVEEEPEMMGYTERKINMPDFENMTSNEIRDWAKSNGYGSVIRNTRDKEKLIKLLRG